MMKLFDYIYYKFDKYYAGEPNPNFHPIYALTLISLCTLIIILNSTELLIREKLIDTNGDPVLFFIISLSLVAFFCTLFYFVYVKSGRNVRIAIKESRFRRIFGWVGIIILMVGLFVLAGYLYMVRFATFD